MKLCDFKTYIYVVYILKSWGITRQFTHPILHDFVDSKLIHIPANNDH